MKSAPKFLRMKSYLSRVMSPDAAWRHRMKLEDWRDCQALLACGFQVVGHSDCGTYFDFPVFAEVVKYDMERSLCLKK